MDSLNISFDIIMAIVAYITTVTELVNFVSALTDDYGSFMWMIERIKKEAHVKNMIMFTNLGSLASTKYNRVDGWPIGPVIYYYGNKIVYESEINDDLIEITAKDIYAFSKKLLEKNGEQADLCGDYFQEEHVSKNFNKYRTFWRYGEENDCTFQEIIEKHCRKNYQLNFIGQYEGDQTISGFINADTWTNDLYFNCDDANLYASKQEHKKEKFKREKQEKLDAIKKGKNVRKQQNDKNGKPNKYSKKSSRYGIKHTFNKAVYAV